MSGDLRWTFDIYGMIGDNEGEGVYEAVTRLLEDQDLIGYVRLGVAMADHMWTVYGRSESPLPVPDFEQWRQAFDGSLRATIEKAVPTAGVTITWKVYPADPTP